MRVCKKRALTRCLRQRSRSQSQEATTGSVSLAPSANTRWIQPTLPTGPTMRWSHQRLYSRFYSAQIYCVHCYELIHGKKAKTKSMPLDTTSIMGEAELGTCPRCSGKVFSAEKMVAASGHYHRHCFRCFTCNQPLDSTRWQSCWKFYSLLPSHNIFKGGYFLVYSLLGLQVASLVLHHLTICFSVCEHWPYYY